MSGHCCNTNANSTTSLQEQGLNPLMSGHCCNYKVSYEGDVIGLSQSPYVGSLL